MIGVRDDMIAVTLEEWKQSNITWLGEEAVIPE